MRPDDGRDDERRDDLDQLLLSVEPYIEDEGFTDRVLARLPKRRRTASRWLLLIGVASLASSLFVLIGATESLVLVARLPSLVTAAPTQVPQLITALAMLIAVVWLPLTMALEDE